jgi:hypothetical protein
MMSYGVGTGKTGKVLGKASEAIRRRVQLAIENPYQFPSKMNLLGRGFLCD